MEIKIPYSPRPLQKELHARLKTKRWAVVVCHRRFGKTVMAINHLLRDAVLNTKENPRYAYIAPTYRQAKMITWDYLKTFAGGIPKVRFHETELRCDLPNGARIQLLGAENVHAIRGIYLDGVCADEFSDMPESLFPEVLRPALSDRKGWAMIVGTPRGMNAFYDMYEAAQADKHWITAIYKASETGLLDDEELESAKAAMSEDQYNQEFECSWTANVAGAIYGKEIEGIMSKDQISDVPYDETTRVDTWWDLGINDSTCIIFTQTIGRAVHIIDCYENRGEGLPHYCRVLDQKGYLYGTHNAPHDIEVRELGTGKSRREIAYDLGLNFRVVPKLPLEDGIHAGKLFFSRLWFDRVNCKQLLDALRHYHRAYNEKNRVFRTTPVHSWASHYADAYRYLAVGYRENRDYSQPPQAMAEDHYNPLGAYV